MVTVDLFNRRTEEVNNLVGSDMEIAGRKFIVLNIGFCQPCLMAR